MITKDNFKKELLALKVISRRVLFQRKEAVEVFLWQLAMKKSKKVILFLSDNSLAQRLIVCILQKRSFTPEWRTTNKHLPNFLPRTTA